MPAERHGGVEFLVDDLQRFGHARFAGGAQAPQEGAADVGAACAERPGFQHVLPAANARIHVHFDLLSHGIDNGRQRDDGRGRAVQLAPPVVADDERIGA